MPQHPYLLTVFPLPMKYSGVSLTQDRGIWGTHDINMLELGVLLLTEPTPQ